MIYIYDILVNFTDSNDRVYEFFEWDRKDVIEHIKKIPLIRVNDQTFYDFMNNDVSIELSDLEHIKNKAISFSSNSSSYLFLISNLKRAYALELDSVGNIISRSSLLIDEEDEVITFARDVSISDISYSVKKNNNNNIISTRNEKRNRNIVFREINDAYNSNNISKLNYLYEECFNEKGSDISSIYKRLVSFLDDNRMIRKLLFIFKLTRKKRKISNND